MIRMSARLVCIVSLLVAATARQTHAAAVGTAFTYQGKLSDNGQPANGLYDLQFKLFDAAAGGTQVGGTVGVADLSISGGLFTTSLFFGNSVFDGNARWLEIAVFNPGSGQYVALSPRQALRPAPYAVGLSLPYAAEQSSSTPLFSIDQAGSGEAVAAFSTAVGDAIYAQTSGGGNAVFAYNLGTGGRAGFFRTESVNNASNAVDVQANGTGMGLKASARTNYAGYFENTNAANTATTLRIETNGAGSAVWGKTTGTGSGGRFEISNASNSNPALDVRTNGTGLAAKFTGGAVEVGGELYAQTGTVLNRATPIAWGTLYPSTADPELVTSSGNVTVSYVSGWGFRVQVIGEGDPENWTVIATPRYTNNPDDDFEITLKVGAPLAVAGQPGTGVFYISSRCTNGCDEFVPPSWFNFVVYKGQ